MTIKVVCDAHRPMRYSYPRAGAAMAKATLVVECEKPECQALMAERRLAVAAAGAPTEAEQAAWVDWLPGRALAKVGKA